MEEKTVARSFFPLKLFEAVMDSIPVKILRVAIQDTQALSRAFARDNLTRTFNHHTGMGVPAGSILPLGMRPSLEKG